METEIILSDNGRVPVITVIGKLDKPAMVSLKKVLLPLMKNLPPNVVIDCRRMRYINSSSTAYLAQVHQQAMANFGVVILVGIGNKTEKFLRHMKVHAGFITAETIEEAMAKVPQR